MAARYEEGCYEKCSLYSHVFLFGKHYRPMTSGWQKGTAFQAICSHACFEINDSVNNERLGGAKVE